LDGAARAGKLRGSDSGVAVVMAEGQGGSEPKDGNWWNSSGWWWLNPWSYPGPRHAIGWVCGSHNEEARSRMLDWQRRWYTELAKHANGDPGALKELSIILKAWSDTPNQLWNFRLSTQGGGYCAAFLENLCARLPRAFRDKNSILKVTPVWFQQGDPGFWAGVAIMIGVCPGHFALRVEFPDGFVVYSDNGWAGTGGIFAFMAGTGVPIPKRFLRDEIPTVPEAGEPWWPCD
jgi:hypothetical protein